MKLSKTEVEFATSVVRKLLLSNISHLARDNPLFERIAHADLETLIVLGEGILTEQGWDREPPAPELPSDIIEKTRQRYFEAYRRLTNENIPER